MDAFEYLFGIVLIMILGFLYFLIQFKAPTKYRKEEKDEAKSETIQTLFTDLNYNDDLLDKGFEHRTRYQHWAFWHELHTTGLESVFVSPRYQSLSSDAQNRLSRYYEKVQKMKKLVRRLDGEERTREIQKISVEQTRLLKDLRSISSRLRTILNAE